MRATLTDDGCAYEGDTTHAPGLFSVEVENKSSHFASFALYPLAAGKNVQDVQLAYDILVDPRRGRYVRGTSDRLFVSRLPWGTRRPPSKSPRKQRARCRSTRPAADS